IEPGGEENNEKRLTVLRAIDKLDRLGVEGVIALLGQGRKDESGDFTKGANLDPQQISRLMSFITAKPRFYREGDPRRREEGLIQEIEAGGNLQAGPIDNFATIEALKRLFPSNRLYQSGIDELAEIARMALDGGYQTERILVDPSVVRGLEYYTGPVYEVELTFATTDEGGRPVRFGSVGGGGRYDGLVARFRGEAVPATGFSIGVSRLMAALIHLGKIDAAAEPGPVVVTVFDRDRIADYQCMATVLRDAGIRAELYLGSGRMGPQLKYADKRRAPCVVIQGGDEKARGEVQIKDLIEGAKASAAIASNKEWRATRPAQFSVAEDKLVEAVRDVLGRHGVSWRS
ncbi:MAG: ATP phosphoribosyltransferase regulatory subunit, partial [Xanthobacteraceae bacterium]